MLKMLTTPTKALGCFAIKWPLPCTLTVDSWKGPVPLLPLFLGLNSQVLFGSPQRRLRNTGCLCFLLYRCCLARSVCQQGAEKRLRFGQGSWGRSWLRSPPLALDGPYPIVEFQRIDPFRQVSTRYVQRPPRFPWGSSPLQE